MTGDTTQEEVVSVSGDGDGIVASGVGGDWGGGVARSVLGMGHLHHVVKLRIVLET